METVLKSQNWWDDDQEELNYEYCDTSDEEMNKDMNKTVSTEMLNVDIMVSDDESQAVNQEQTRQWINEIQDNIEGEISDEIQKLEQIQDNIKEDELEEGEIEDKLRKLEDGKIENGLRKIEDNIELRKLEEGKELFIQMKEGNVFDNFIEERIKPHNVVYGALAMYFPHKSYKAAEYAIATMTHGIRCDCKNEWQKKLNRQIQKLHITHFFVAGQIQKDMIKKYVTGVSIQFVEKTIPTNPSRCANCKKFGCTMFKAKRMLLAAHAYMYNSGCE